MTVESANVEDPRLAKLRRFLERRNCPLLAYAKDLLAAADRHRLDWRLLPSISVIETSGGHKTRNNNPFGWGNGKLRFRDMRDSIHTVADKLANGRAYRGKTMDQVLWVYNPVVGYPQRVRTVMEEMPLN